MADDQWTEEESLAAVRAYIDMKPDIHVEGKDNKAALSQFWLPVYFAASFTVSLSRRTLNKLITFRARFLVIVFAFQ